MKFQDYLQKSKNIAIKEINVLNSLKKFDDIEIRAAKSSLQVLIENFIGKCKRILKYHDCPIVPKRSSDALFFLYEVGVFDEEEYGEFLKMIGFRNAMIHDYMDFNEEILIHIVKEKLYLKLYDFLVTDVKLSDTMQKRIRSFEL